jgi:hypothetical protein
MSVAGLWKQTLRETRDLARDRVKRVASKARPRR